MTKQIIVEMSDARYKEFRREFDEIIDLANYVEATVTIRDS